MINSVPLVTGRMNAYDKGGNKENIQLARKGKWSKMYVNNDGKYTVNEGIFTFVYFEKWHYRHPQEVVQEQADGQR